MSFPRVGQSIADLEVEMDALLAEDADQTLTGLNGPPEADEIARIAYARFFSHNALLGPRLPSVWKMQSELGAMVIDLLNGGPEARYSLTTGGSESIFCAVHAMREWARDKKPEITQPELIVPYSAHAGFTKACHYLGLTLKQIALGDDFRADVAAMEAAIGPNTIGIVGSAPCWPYGLYDAIPEIAAMGAKFGLWVHVDACVGGFFAPFARKLGVVVPDWDLSVPGVCSISADLHKYGWAPKPASMVLYTSEEYHRYQPHVVEDWPTGPYRTETVVGSRPGGAIAAAWAVFRHLGEEGFLRSTARILDIKARLITEIDAMPGLRVFANDLCLFHFQATSDRFDADSVAKGMRERGWFLFGTRQPPVLMFALSAVADDEPVDRFVADLRATVEGFTEPASAEGELSYAA